MDSGTDEIVVVSLGFIVGIIEAVTSELMTVAGIFVISGVTVAVGIDSVGVGADVDSGGTV